MKSTSPSVSNRPLFVFALPDFPRQHRPSRGGSQPGPAASSGPVRSDPATDLEEWHRPAFWAVRVPNYRCVSESYIFLTCFLPEESCCFQDSFFFVASPIAFFGPLLVIKGLRPAMFSSCLAIKKKAVLNPHFFESNLYFTGNFHIDITESLFRESPGPDSSMLDFPYKRTSNRRLNNQQITSRQWIYDVHSLVYSP